MTEQERNKEIVGQFFARLERGDVDGAIALFAKDGTFWSPSTRKTSTMEEFAAALRWVNSILEAPMIYEVGVMTAEENRVSVLAESSARMLNGKDYHNVYNFHFALEGGLIVQAREYNDTAHIWATLRSTF